jgi:hypothetical protein
LFRNITIGIDADLYMLPKDSYGGTNKDNQCFNEDDYDAEDGLQNISPCQYGTYSRHLSLK